MQAIAQAGREYSPNKYDVDRYKQLQDLAAEIIQDHTGHEFGHIRNFLEQEVGYATPKVDVRGVVFRDGEILLVRETVDGLWSLPGGWADVLLTPSENVLKEIREESGYETRAKRLLAVYDRSKHEHGNHAIPYSIYKLFFQCELVGGSPKPSIETSAAEFFALDQLPPLSVGRVTERQLNRMAELVKTGEVDFD